MQAKQWAQKLLDMRGPGYSESTVGITPYIHILIYHIPDMLRLYKSIAVFARQGKHIYIYIEREGERVYQ